MPNENQGDQRAKRREPSAKRHRAWPLLGLALAGSLLLGCSSVEISNLLPAREVERGLQAPGSLYTGWRVYQERCARCHGAAGAGGEQGPNLLPLLQTMGPRRFVGLVLQRYDWTLPPGQDRDTWIEQAVRRQEASVPMPAWQNEPEVNVHIMDLYAYLSARADGRQGPGRPQP